MKIPMASSSSLLYEVSFSLPKIHFLLFMTTVCDLPRGLILVRCISVGIEVIILRIVVAIIYLYNIDIFCRGGEAAAL